MQKATIYQEARVVNYEFNIEPNYRFPAFHAIYIYYIIHTWRISENTFENAYTHSV